MLANAVESTTLAAVGYDADGQLLWLEFGSHAIYCYFGVPATVHHALLDADSKGAFFNRHIRGRFPYQRVVTDRPVSLPTAIR
jgi:hypothetical protein